MTQTAKYSSTERLGSGPTCDVFLGRDIGGLNRRVAIKQLREEFRGHAARREAFFAAAERWSQFKHEGLVTLFDLDRAEGAVIYEPHEKSGKQAIAGGAKSPHQVRELLAQTAAALGYIHDQRLLHLNLKPTNVLLDSAGRAKLIDGLCYERDHLGELPVPSGGQKYLAPELIDPALGHIGPATDIYSLGFVTLEFLLGSAFDELFRGVGVDAVDTDRNWLRWHAARDEPLPALGELLPELSSELERVLHRMLSKDPLQRYHAVAELLDELRTVPGGPATVRETPLPTFPRFEANGGVAPDRARPAPVTAAPSGEAPKLEDIPHRPTAPVVIRFLGCEAEMVGMNKDFFTLGDTVDCDVPFPPALRRDGQTVFRLGRAAEGWRLNSPSGITYYLNQEVATASSNLRSGDIVRLAPGGPGIQFTILNQNAESLAKLAARYAPRLVQPGTETPSAKPAPPPLLSAHAAPRAPSAAPAPPPKVKPAAPARAVAPAAPTQRREAAPAPPAKPPAAKSRATDLKRLARWLDYKNWDKSTKNWVTLIVSLVTMGLIIALWPVEESPTAEETPTNESAPAGTTPSTPDAE